MDKIKFRGWHFKESWMDRGFMGSIESFRINLDDSYTWNCLEKGNEGGWQPLITNHPKHTTGIIMQFTGLKDKNGKDIYEGDIIKRKYSVGVSSDMFTDIGEVVFGGGAFMIKGCASYNWHIDTPEGSIKEWEVIGNIYENQELFAKDGTEVKNG